MISVPWHDVTWTSLETAPILRVQGPRMVHNLKDAKQQGLVHTTPAICMHEHMKRFAMRQKEHMSPTCRVSSDCCNKTGHNGRERTQVDKAGDKDADDGHELEEHVEAATQLGGRHL